MAKNSVSRIAIIGLDQVGLTYAFMLGHYEDIRAIDYDHKLDIDRLNKKDREYIKENIGELNYDVLSYDIDETIVQFYDSINVLNNEKFGLIMIVDSSPDFRNKKITSILEDLFKDVKTIKNKPIFIKSSCKPGYINRLRELFNYNNIYYLPDLTSPDRIAYDFINNNKPVIVGIYDNSKMEKAIVGEMLEVLQERTDNETKFEAHTMPVAYAETVKIWHDIYLAARATIFNELETYCNKNKISADKIISYITKDNLIGDHYCNPSFGLSTELYPSLYYLQEKEVPLAKNILDAKDNRSKMFVKNIIKNIIEIKERNKNKTITIGMYRLTDKSSNDVMKDKNESIDLFKNLVDLLIEKELIEDCEIIYYEPLSHGNMYSNKSSKIKLVNDINKFAESSDLIIANTLDLDLIIKNNIKCPIFTCDLLYDNPELNVITKDIY